MVDSEAEGGRISAGQDREAVLAIAAGDDVGGQAGLDSVGGGRAGQVLGVVAAQLEADAVDGADLGGSGAGLVDRELGDGHILGGRLAGGRGSHGTGAEEESGNSSETHLDCFFFLKR